MNADNNGKVKLRRLMTTIRKRIPEYDRNISDTAISCSLERYIDKHQFHKVCTYISLPDEVDTRKIISWMIGNDIQVIVPRILSGTDISLSRISGFQDLVLGKYNIYEPDQTCAQVNPGQIDLFVIPGIAYDRQGNRLGWGMGYYDRLLSNIAVPIVGLAYDCQVISKLPHDKHDIMVSTIITAKEVIEILPASLYNHSNS
jgi:5-formyltetrahydrofolate cyclo-ligase